MVQRLSRNEFVCELSADHSPAYQVQVGEVFVVETQDCHGGQVLREGRSLQERDRALSNPATGPILVEGLQPGDAAAVEVLDVKVADRGIVVAGPEWKVVPIENGAAVFAEDVRLPVEPVIGVIGLAPREGAVPTVTPGDHGGNLDTVDIRPGATIVLPVAHEGGLLALGDVHAVQGDGEISGTGLEVEAEAVLRVTRVVEPLSARPYILTATQVATIGSAPEWPEAIRTAVDDMVALVAKRRGVSPAEAKMLVSLAGDLKFSQIVNPWMTARMVMPRVLAKC